MANTTSALDFDHMSPGKLFIKLFFPTLLGMFFGSIMNITDGVLVGQKAGSDALAAINIASPIYLIVTGLALMFGIGSSVHASITLAQGQQDRANREITTALLVSSSAMLLIAIFMMIMRVETANLFGSTIHLRPLVIDYMVWVIPSLPLYCIMISGMYYVRLDGAPRYAMLCETIPSIMNIILDYIFIFPCDMGVKGAALASSLSSTVGGTMILLYLFFFSKRIHLISLKAVFAKGAHFFHTILLQMKLGFSGLLGELALSLMIIMGNYVFKNLEGEPGVAAYSIACYCSPLLFMINNAIAQSAQPIISYDYGAKRWDRIHAALRLCMTTALVCAIIMTLFLHFFSHPLISLFINNDPITFKLAQHGIPLFAIDLFFLAINIILICYFQSIKRGTWASVFTLLRGYVFLILCFILFPLWWGINGAWLAIPGAEAFTTLCILGFLTIRHFHQKRLALSSEQ